MTHSSPTSLYTDGTTAEILAAIPKLCLPTAVASTELCQKRVVIIGGSIGGLAAAACLRAAGFVNVQVVEKAAEHRPGAGIGLDDASVGILKGLGLELGSYCTGTPSPSDDERKETLTVRDVTVQRMRWVEERIISSPNSQQQQQHVLSRQPYPYSAVRYNELTQGLEKVATVVVPDPFDDVKRGGLQRGMKAVDIIEDSSSKTKVQLENALTGESLTLEADLVIVADGPRSRFRSHFGSEEEDLRFAGYTAWRGTVPETDLPGPVRAKLQAEYSHFSNCLYFLWGPLGKSAVLYDIGNGLVNWLIYECCDQPKAAPGRTTTTATPEDIAHLQQHAKEEWGDALGSVIECTPSPFQNDIYDIQTPLDSFTTNAVNSTMCLLGDAAHPITPHCAKGSNLAIHDAYLLACAAVKAQSVSEMVQLYSKSRVMDCRNAVLMSRHLGRLRNGMPPMVTDGNDNMLLSKEPLPRPPDTITLELDVVALSGIPTATLPLGDDAFEPVWKFMEEHIPESDRGFWLRREKKSAMDPDKTSGDSAAVTGNDVLPSLEIVEVNHISLETENVDQLVSFYQGVLGLPPLPRPDFGFGGAWLKLPGGLALHIIERDPEKPTPPTIISVDNPTLPERFIRRSRHVALTVLDIETAKSTLTAHGIPFAINKVPNTTIEQLFLYDPDGNGIEIGNFNA